MLNYGINGLLLGMQGLQAWPWTTNNLLMGARKK